jgi:nitrous oxidase accessory protein
LALLCALSGVLLAAPASAQSEPFDLATAVATAQPGDTITVPAGVYAGPLRIDKPLTLLGEGEAVIDGGGQGDVIIIAAPDVTIRGFVIRNSGDSLDHEHAGIVVTTAHSTIENNRLEDVLFGIYLKNAPGSILRNNLVLSKALGIARRGDSIKIWYSAGCLVEDNQVRDGRDLLVWYSPDCTVRNNLIERNRYGVHVMNSDHQVLENNILRNNSVGIYIMYGREILLRNNVVYSHRGPSGFGIGLKDAVNVTATGNRLVGNRAGLYVDNSPPEPAATVRFERNLFAYNEIGAELLPNVKRNVYVQNSFLENGEQVAIAGGGDAMGNQWSEAGQGNYWSDYAGFDADGDQIGDLPYLAQSLFEDLLQQHPELRLLQLSPAATALDLAARAFPIFQPRPKLADEYPLVAPPALPVVAGLPTPPVAGNLVVAVGMVGVAVFILLGVRGIVGA